MMTILLTISMASFAADPPADKPRSSIAPSLPALTPRQEAIIDQVINQFIQADIGALRGDEARAAQTSFDGLGPEAIPQLIRALNRVATMEQSCPVLVITKKLTGFLLASKDPELLEFAHDNIGAGVPRNRHTRAIEDLRFQIQQRKNLLARRPPPPTTPQSMTTAELVKAVGTETGAKLPPLLRELETRKAPDALKTLAAAASGAYGSDVTGLAQELLERNASRQVSVSVLEERLKSDNAEVRRATARAAAARNPPMGAELINLLADDVAQVRTAAHDGLVKINKGNDLGPAANATPEEISQAQARWRTWWTTRLVLVFQSRNRKRHLPLRLSVTLSRKRQVSLTIPALKNGENSSSLDHSAQCIP